jgi:hypothetical protein
MIQEVLAINQASGADLPFISALTGSLNTWKQVRNDICHSSVAYKTYIGDFSRYEIGFNRAKKAIDDALGYLRMCYDNLRSEETQLRYRASADIAEIVRLGRLGIPRSSRY